MRIFFEGNRKQGFTLLLASLIASIVLVLGGAMYQLAQKGVLLSGLGRDSQFAFYAADGAAECALYFDVRQSYFNPNAAPATILCDGQTATITTAGDASLPMTFSFQYEPNGMCAKITVTKSATDPKTTIDASGYNVVCSAISGSTRALERSVQLHY